MGKLIDIFDVFLLPNNKLVLGGINDALNHFWIEEVKNLIKDKNVILKRPGFNDVLLNVLDVEITNSLIDQKNFFLLINNNLSPSDIVKGSEVYYE
jgi:hypothetical protein